MRSKWLCTKLELCDNKIDEKAHSKPFVGQLFFHMHPVIHKSNYSRILKKEKHKLHLTHNIIACNHFKF